MFAHRVSSPRILSRRRVLAGLTAAAALGPTLLRPTRAFADGECQVVNDTLRHCTVGLRVSMETVRQRCDNWCWAACIQAVFAFHGHDVEQEAMVQKIFGDPNACEPGNDEEIIATINGTWIDNNGNEFSAYGEELPWAAMGISESATQRNPLDAESMADSAAISLFATNDLRTVIDELANNNPLILARNGIPTGHAMVLTAVSFYETAQGGLALHEFIVRDPWGQNANRRNLPPQEIRDTAAIFKVTVQG